MANATYDPLLKKNNLFGIHILFTDEIEKAASIVNSAGGQWGYVTIPIQVGDRDLDKWQEFMSKCYVYKIIPIIRLATESDYKKTGVWRKPTEEDILDFANFLSSIAWPVKNRYIILFNEVNRYDEWGGEDPSPEQYADIANYAVDVFKSKSEDFFLIMAGLDNASPNSPGKYIDKLDYLKRIGIYKQTLFNRFDGFASHAYPNPAFSQPPESDLKTGIRSYRFEYDVISQFLDVKKPIFITETGWDSILLPQDVVSKYYSYAFESVWKKDSDKIAAVTPFLLNSQNGVFDKFSFFKDGQMSGFAKAVSELSKEKGDPELNPAPPTKQNIITKAVLGIKDLSVHAQALPKKINSAIVKYYFKTIFGLQQ